MQPDAFLQALQSIAKTLAGRNVNKTTDANGWICYNNGLYRVYTQRFAVNVAVTNLQRALACSFTLPPGRAQGEFTFGLAWVGIFSGHASIGVDSSALTDTALQCYLENCYNGSALTFVGYIHITLTER